MQYINNQWISGQGEPLVTKNPATGEISWEGNSASMAEVEYAVGAANVALNQWRLRSVNFRLEILQRYAACIEEQKTVLAECIAEETGKPFWESATEVTSMIGKIKLSAQAYSERTGDSEKPLQGAVSVVRHHPIGVMAVLGPFNFPGHLPNGQIVPALLAGNTIVFKPSELTPKTSIFLAKLWEQAGFPAGVINLVLGSGKVGQTLTSHPYINGILFTGSYATGKKLHLQCAGQPEKMLVLEMGGNNPLIVWDVKNKDAAAYHILQSAFISAGQRCTCARRLIIAKGEEGDRLLSRLKSWMAGIKVGYWRDEPEPFMGPVISQAAAHYLLEKQAFLIAHGGEPLIKMQHIKPETGLLSPGLIDITMNNSQEDIELFGPLLQVIRVQDFDEALRVANDTQYRLAAGLQSDSREHYDRFFQTIHAGVLSWNRPTTGASSAAPFGGIGQSGNYRPGSYYAADYCAYPVASSESTQLILPENLLPGLCSSPLLTN
ncbi:MAG: succinylglutamate-semialdehyde dehydrogenase [Legionellales bacterium]|nr:succinylglutamate-semialdehyde dehydrogenase [Legionellales bacterium]